MPHTHIPTYILLIASIISRRPLDVLREPFFQTQIPIATEKRCRRFSSFKRIVNEHQFQHIQRVPPFSTHDLKMDMSYLFDRCR
jgi:hypothetical protein